MASGATLVDESCDAMSVFPHPQPLKPLHGCRPLDAPFSLGEKGWG